MSSNQCQKRPQKQTLAKPFLNQKQKQEQEQKQKQEQEKGTGKPSPAAFSDKSVIAEGVDPTHLKDWIKARKSAITKTAWEGLKAEAVKAGISPAEAVRICAVKGWRGFDSTWKWQSAVSAGVTKTAAELRDDEAMALLGITRDYIDA